VKTAIFHNMLMGERVKVLHVTYSSKLLKLFTWTVRLFEVTVKGPHNYGMKFYLIMAHGEHRNFFDNNFACNMNLLNLIEGELTL
jgi:hypothetical protein